jgi:hypothetical protein
MRGAAQAPTQAFTVGPRALCRSAVRVDQGEGVLGQIDVHRVELSIRSFPSCPIGTPTPISTVFMARCGSHAHLFRFATRIPFGVGVQWDPDWRCVRRELPTPNRDPELRVAPMGREALSKAAEAMQNLA